MTASQKITPAMVRGMELRPVDRLVPYARNARTHSDEQVDQIAASIAEFGFNSPILLASDAGIVAGHGRLLAARKLALAEVLVVVLDRLSETQRQAYYLIADNKPSLRADGTRWCWGRNSRTWRGRASTSPWSVSARTNSKRLWPMFAATSRRPRRKRVFLIRKLHYLRAAWEHTAANEPELHELMKRDLRRQRQRPPQRPRRRPAYSTACR
jgi:hypothetical protein